MHRNRSTVTKIVFLLLKIKTPNVLVKTRILHPQKKTTYTVCVGHKYASILHVYMSTVEPRCVELGLLENPGNSNYFRSPGKMPISPMQFYLWLLELRLFEFPVNSR